MALPFLDIARPGFSTKSREVIDARAAHWCAETPFGFAVLRYRQAGQLLRDRRLRQGSYAWPDTVGLKGRFAEFWKASLISQEGTHHKALRQIVQEALSDDFILGLKPAFHRIASTLLDGLPKNAPINVVDTFSEPFAGRAITTLLGLPDADAEDLAKDASALGLAMGLDAKNHEATSNAACIRISTLAETLIGRAETGKDSKHMVARMLTSSTPLDLTNRQELIDLIVIAIFGGVDTTRAQLAFAAHLFAQYPDQWKWLRQNPQAIPQAIEEVIRHFPTTTWATREAIETIEHDGVAIPKGATVHIFVHASATDPDVTKQPGFDIRVPRKMHFGFGGGAHHCLGQFVARTDMAAALSEMLTRWSGIEIIGTPRFLPDSGNTSPAELIIQPEWV